MKSKFELGRIVVTDGIVNLVKNGVSAGNISDCIIRHRTGDWGEGLCKEDRDANDYAVEHGERILSAYEVGENKIKIWIITEADRSYTTILLPEEY